MPILEEALERILAISHFERLQLFLSFRMRIQSGKAHVHRRINVFTTYIVKAVCKAMFRNGTGDGYDTTETVL